MCGWGTIKRRSNEVRGVWMLRWAFIENVARWGETRCDGQITGDEAVGLQKLIMRDLQPLSSRYLCAALSVKRVYTLRAGACDSDSRLCVLAECCKRTE